MDSISVNEHAGTKDPDDWVIIARASFKRKNRGKTAKDMIDMYSSDLAASLGKTFPNIQEIAVMWHAEYIDGSAKCSYEKYEDGNMYEMDMSWDKTFQ